MREGDSQPYRRFDNFNQGDVHRLVTLSSPHLGSQFSNMLINAHNNFAHGYFVVEWPTSGEDPVPLIYNPIDTLEEFLSGKLGATLHQGAVCDLAENSVAIASTGASDVETRAETASNGPQGHLFLPFYLGLSGFNDAMAREHIDPYVFNTLNDAIVAQDSQQGRLSVGINDPEAIHFHVDPYFLPGITHSNLVASDAFSALDSTDTSRFAPLPSVPSSMDGVPRLGVGRSGFDAGNYSAQCGVGGPMNTP